MIPYVGKEPERRGRIRRVSLSYDRFLMGWDTLRIADYYGVHEATALRWITEERCRVRGLPLPYADV